MALTEVNVRNNDGEVVFLLRFFDPSDGDFTSETNSTRNVSQAEIRAVTQAAQYWTGVLKPRGTMPGYQDANNPGQPVVINIGTANENGAWGNPLTAIDSQTSDPFLVHMSTALLADGTNIAPTTSGHGVMIIGTGLNTSSNSLIQSGRVANDVTTTAVHEFGHILGIFSSMDSRGEDVARRAELFRFPQELTRYQSHLRDSNGNSSVPGAHPNVPGKPVDYDPTKGNLYMFDMGDPNSPSQPADFTFIGQNTLAVYYDYNEKLIGDKKDAGEGVPLQGLVPNPDFLMGEPGADRWIYSDPDTLSHIDVRNSTMSWQMYRHYPMFLEVELAVMQDLGYDINRRDLFGRSYYVDGDGTTVTNNSAGFSSLSAYGIGLHMFANNLNIVQHGNIFAGGPGATGIRVDGVGNTLTIAPGTSINAGLPKGYKLASDNQSSIFRNYGEDVSDDNTIRQGVEGIGLLVSYGKDHHIIHRGSIIAQGKYGAGVRFDFGEPFVGSRLGSYAYDPNYGYMEDGNLIGGFPDDIQGPLVKAFDITGSIKGSRASAETPTFEAKRYGTIAVTTSMTSTDTPIIIDTHTGEITNLSLLSIGSHRWQNTGYDGGLDPNGDAARGNYGQHYKLLDPYLLGSTVNPGEIAYRLNVNEVLVIIWDDDENLLDIVRLQHTNPPNPKYTFDQDAWGCWEIFEHALNDYFVPVQPTVSMDIAGGGIYIAGSKLDPVTGAAKQCC